MGCSIMAISVAAGHYWWQHWMRTSWVEDLCLPPRQLPFALVWGANRLGVMESAVGQLALASCSLEQPLLLRHWGTYWGNEAEVNISRVAVCLPSCCHDGNLNAHLKSILTQFPRVWGQRSLPGCEACDRHDCEQLKIFYLVGGEVNTRVVWQLQLNKDSSWSLLKIFQREIFLLEQDGWYLICQTWVLCTYPPKTRDIWNAAVVWLLTCLSFFLEGGGVDVLPLCFSTPQWEGEGKARPCWGVRDRGQLLFCLESKWQLRPWREVLFG